jgi:hypothetical protein
MTPSSSMFNATTAAILGGVFILGIGIGIAFSSVTNTNEGQVATREEIERAAPNPELCIQFGASAVVIDTRAYLTLNPFTVHISQPKMQPGCVLRSTNFSILEQRKLVNSEQVRDCRNSMNTFGFTGNLESSPQINCVYQSKGQENLFLNRPGAGTAPPETSKF